ncbi:hypothetical protein CYY_001972 [Polysphondylium violaceum]|uniref:Uncharacterized protein n=1 Tax=Polysphondylium violaceum TaxID=133409 RepID=A0A8J4Q070_9MYCE|nr:hypothetical protein CYY_001972 [Polysphondylium violaceum]
MWITEFEKRGVQYMKGAFFLWRPILRNNYFLLQKQNTKFLLSHSIRISDGNSSSGRGGGADNNRSINKEQEQSTSIHNQINRVDQHYTDYTEKHERWVDFKLKVWKKIYDYLPESWKLAPNETFRIVSIVDPFNPKQIATAAIQTDIESHWVSINNDIFDRIKKIPDSNEKERIINVYLDSKHSDVVGDQPPPSIVSLANENKSTNSNSNGGDPNITQL